MELSHFISISVWAVLGLVSCGSNSLFKDGKIPEYKLVDGTKEVSSLEGMIEEAEVIRFDTDSTLYVSPDKIVFSTDKMFVLSDGQILSFDMEGKFIGEVGKIGRGPGEYTMARDFCLSRDCNEIWCLSNHNSVLRYSASTFDFISDVSTDHAGTANAVVPVSDNLLGLLFQNPTQDNLTNFDDGYKCLPCYDFSGKLVDSFIDRDDFNNSMAMFSPSIQCSGNRYVLSYQMSSGTFYEASEKGVEAFAYLDLGKDALPYRYMVEGGDPWAKIGDVFESSYLKSPSGVCMTGKFIYALVFGENSLGINFIVDRKTGKGIRWESSRFAMPKIPIAADDDYFYFVMSQPDFPPEFNLPAEAAVDVFQTAVEQKADFKLEDEDDPIIVKVKFKIG